MPRQPLRLSPVDLLVLIPCAIVVVALIVMRVSGDREASRRMECESNLRNVFLAVDSYALRFGHFPIGTQNPESPIRSEPSGYHHNWITGLLPLLDRQPLYDQIDFQFGVYAAENRSIATAELAEVRCAASSVTLSPNATSYVGVTSSTERPIDQAGDGMFVLGHPLSQRDASDGASFVLLIGEKARDFGPPTQWNSGTRTSLRTAGHRINGPVPEKEVNPLWVGGFSSNHAGGAYFLLVDGSFRFFSDQTDPELLRQMAARGDRM